VKELSINERFIENAITIFGLSIIKIAFSITGNKHDAEDVSSDVFLTLWKTKKRFETKEHLKAWLIRVTINKARNLVGQAFYKHCAELKDDIYYEDKKDNRVKEALSKLKPKARAIVYLYYYEGYSHKEIGQLLKMKESSIRLRALRAREKMREILEDME